MTDKSATNSYNSNGGNMNDSSPAPRERLTFADLVSVIQARLDIGLPDPVDEIIPTHPSHLSDLLACIREQQAALAACLGQAQKGPIPEITRWEEARAVLEKWRIE